jgi:hypothetical protein
MAYHVAGRGARVGAVAVVVAAGVSSLACGLRTDPLFMGTPTGDDAGDDVAATGDVVIDPDRMGACAQPFQIPFENTTISGTLPDDHGSLYAGWCGRDDGVEDVYQLAPFYDADVTFTFAPGASDFRPTLRVQADPCGDSEGAIPICATDPIDTDYPFHFLARNGTVYWVTIDSGEAGLGGAYAFDVQIGDPGAGACPVHPERISQSPGASFVWGNSFSSGQGYVDGFCGGPGKENMFQLDAFYEGNVYVRADGTGGFSPVVSLRTSCSALTELQCGADGESGIVGTAELYGYIPGPGTYFLAIDNAGVDAGDYSLRVDFQ